MTGTRRILVVVLDNLGDTVMATAVIASLRRFFPGVRIGFWCKSYAAGALDGGLVETIHASDPFWDGAPGAAPGRVSDFARALREVRAARYDLAIILNSEWRRAAAVWLAGVPRRAGLGRRKSGWFLTDAVSPGEKRHMTDDHRRVVEALVGQPPRPAPFLPELRVSTDDVMWARQWRAALGWALSDLVVVHPFAGDPVKCWPLDRWAELLSRLSRRFPSTRFALICAAAELEPTARAFGHLDPALIRVLAGSPLGHIKALLRDARIFVGGDSGPAHMAAALGTPALALFGPTDPERYAPRGKRAVRILRRDPLTGLAIDTVEDAACDLIAADVSARPA